MAEHAAASGALSTQILEGWVRDYAGLIVKICYLSLMDRDLAQDAAQDTFLKAWKQIRKKAKIENEKAYLTRIAINVCRDYQRSSWHKKVDRNTALEDMDIAAPECDRTLALAIADLPENCKRAILLYYYQNLTLRETAATMRMPRSTVHQLIKKAEALLKTHLTGGGEQ